MDMVRWRWARPRRLLRLLRKDPANWRLFARALRYRFDRNALRFTTQVIKPLAGSPDPVSRRLVLFAHFDLDNRIDPYVVLYLRALKKLGSAIIFVSGSPNLDRDSAAELQSLCAGIYTQETFGLDFGSWNLAWQHLRAAGWKLESFEQLILANDSVYGPLYDLEEMFDSFRGADIYGVTENLEFDRHLQSFFLVFQLNPRTVEFVKNFWKSFQYEVVKQDLIVQCEVGVSVRARAAGLQVKPLISDEALQLAASRHADHQFRREIDERSVNNTLYFWDILISELRCPFLKTEIAKNNPYRSTLVPQLESFLRTHTKYPVELIAQHVARVKRSAASDHTTMPSPKLSR